MSAAKHALGPKKPTPAQAEWLRAIDKGVVYRCGHSWVNGMRNRSGSYVGCPGKSTYVMTLALRDAGWIEEAPGEREGPLKDRYRLQLTEAGRAAIAKATGSQS